MGKNDLVVPKNWGIRKKHLDSLPYHELKSTFYGVHNLVIPWAMMDVQNVDEIVA